MWVWRYVDFTSLELKCGYSLGPYLCRRLELSLTEVPNTVTTSNTGWRISTRDRTSPALGLLAVLERVTIQGKAPLNKDLVFNRDFITGWLTEAVSLQVHTQFKISCWFYTCLAKWDHRASQSPCSSDVFPFLHLENSTHSLVDPAKKEEAAWLSSAYNGWSRSRPRNPLGFPYQNTSLG